jgi:hypothetical protein
LEIKYLLDFSNQASSIVDENKIIKNKTNKSFLNKKHWSVEDWFFDISNRLFDRLPERIKRAFRKRYYLKRAMELEKEKYRGNKIRGIFDEEEFLVFITANYVPVSSWIWIDKKSENRAFYDFRRRPHFGVLSWSRNQIEEVVLEWLKFYLKKEIDPDLIRFKDTFL